MSDPKVPVEARDVTHFLAERINGNGGSRGISADAMISAAVLGRTVPKADYPRDLGDLGRCCEAFSRAPAALQVEMLDILAGFIEFISERSNPTYEGTS